MKSKSILLSLALTILVVGQAQALPFTENERLRSQDPAEIVIVDSAVADSEILLESLPEAAVVYRLEMGRDGLSRIGEILSRHRNLEAMHLVSHGRAGRLWLGAQPVDARLLEARGVELARWRGAFREGADLLLYGCEVAAGERGTALVQRLAALVGVDVAASDDSTGRALSGGDWHLEARTGVIEAATPFSWQSRESYPHLLLTTLDWAAVVWNNGDLTNTYTLLPDNVDVTITVTPTAAGTFANAGVLGPYEDGAGGPLNIFGSQLDLGVIFNPSPSQGLSTVLITVTFTAGGTGPLGPAKPVTGLRFEISDIDYSLAGAGEDFRLDQVVVTSDAGDPTLSFKTLAGSHTFSISGNTATANCSPGGAIGEDCNSSVDTTSAPSDSGTAVVDFGGLNVGSVTISYNEASGENNPAARGIGLLASFEFSAAPALNLEKTVTTADGTCGVDDVEELVVDAGTTVKYCYVVENPGDVPLLDVTLIDDNGTAGDPGDDFTVTLSGLTDEDGDGLADDLAAGATATGEASVLLFAALEGTGIGADSLRAGAAGLSPTPRTLVPVQLAPVPDLEPRRLEQLQAGCTTVVNTATATGQAELPDGSLQELTASDTASVLTQPVPGLVLQKTVTTAGGTCGVDDVESLSVSAGDTVKYCYTVDNPGVGALLDLAVADDNATPLDPGDDFTVSLSGLTDEDGDGSADDLASGTTATGEALVTLAVFGTRVNVAAGTGNDGCDATLSATDTATVIVTELRASIDVEKATNGFDADSPPGPELTVGDPVEWTYVVTNTGEATLTDVTVVDSVEGAISCPKSTLAPGELMTCTATGIVQEGAYSNLATASGSGDGTVVEDIDPSHYFGVVPRVASIDVEKATNGFDADSPPGPELTVGDAVEWTYVVTNTGEVTLTDVAVVDSVEGAISCPKSTLAPGETMTCTATGIVQEGAYSNLATASGTGDGTVVEDMDPSHYFGVAEGGTEGCTPGYWKNHTDSWPPTGFSPNQSLPSVFAQAAAYSELASATLLEALRFRGGSGVEGAARILMRAAVAGLLNAAHPGVDYTTSVAQLIADVDAALASGDRSTMLSLASRIDADNNLGCPLS